MFLKAEKLHLLRIAESQRTAGKKQQAAGYIMKTAIEQLAGKSFLKNGITLMKTELWRLAGYS